MTDQEMRLKASEVIANALTSYHYAVEAAQSGKADYPSMAEAVGGIFNHKWEDGPPMIGVISQNQELPENPFPFMTVNLGTPLIDRKQRTRHCDYRVAQQDMSDFRRIVKEE